MTDTSTQPPAAASDAKTPPAAERKPWHAPSLTQVALQVTGQASGTTDDKAGSETINLG